MSKYVRELLRVNLTTGSINVESIPEEVVKEFIGGRGFGIKYLFNEIQPTVSPLSPENKLLLLAGPLAGTSAQSFSRWMVMTKSPLTSAKKFMLRYRRHREG